MAFNEEKEFFQSLAQRPDWLNKTEWSVLKQYYSYSNPSIVQVLNEMADRLIGGQIRSRDEGYRAAERSYKSGRPKVQARVAAEQPCKPQQAQTSSSHRTPWWTYDN
jgi:hypothetical protein